MKILIVEDEEDLRELVCDTLKANGYNILTATNGNEALAHIAEVNIEIAAA